MKGLLVDYLTLLLETISTFAAVYVAYRLALRQDRAKDEQESKANREAQLRLFKVDLERLNKTVSELSLHPTESVYCDAWDAAKFTGRLSTLTEAEFGVLSEIYLSVRSLNDVIENMSDSSTDRYQRIRALTLAILSKIASAQELLKSSTETQQGD